MAMTVAFQKNARNVFFHILTRCNLRCRHCYVNPEQHGRETLPAETAKRWLKELIHEEKETNLIFIGGEPTLHPGLPSLIKAARKMGYASITVDTNGFFFNRILDKVTPDEIDYFSVGLDGSCPEINDFIRGRGSYHKCVAGIQKALAGGFNVSLIYTVSQWNIRDLKNMPGILKALGINRFFIQVIGIRGRSAQDKEDGLQLTRKEWAAVVPRVADRAAIVLNARVSLQTITLFFRMAGFISAPCAKISRYIPMSLRKTSLRGPRRLMKRICSSCRFQRAVS